LFAGLVAVACAGEYIADFTDRLTGGIEERKKKLAKGSTLLLIAALALELMCLVRTNDLSGRVIGSLAERAEEASSKAGEAISKAIVAGTSAASALSLAEEARREADSFEKDIVSAKTQAAAAESHLAEVQQRTAKATEELKRIKSPRSLTHINEMIAALQGFGDTEYTFSSVFSDEDSIRLLMQIDDTLHRAGWKRVKPPYGFPRISVYGKDVDFEVPASLTTGVRVSVENSDASVVSLSLEKLPPFIRAAISLKLNLSSNLFPQQEDDDKKVNVGSGSSTTVFISVGKKP